MTSPSSYSRMSCLSLRWASLLVRPRARLTILFPSGAYPTVTDATHRSGRCPTKDRRHRGFCELASGSVRFLFEKRDVLLDRGCRDQPYTALGYGSQATC